jgi:hypothetical protein
VAGTLGIQLQPRATSPPRVEFEFTRDGLREFGIDTPEQTFDQLDALWA